jgi:hypothetical protein
MVKLTNRSARRNIEPSAPLLFDTRAGSDAAPQVPIEPETRLLDMGKLFSFIGATIGSYAGWALGEKFGFTTAFMLSMVGTGVGIYFGQRVAKNYVD